MTISRQKPAEETQGEELPVPLLQPSPQELTPSQQEGIDLLVRDRRHVFITGGAGTGKSFLVREYLRRAAQDIPVIASTGAAAILIGGRTFHSFFSLGILQGGPAAALKKAVSNSRLRKRLKEAETIVIDEVSMLSQEAFDVAEKIARAVRRCEEPWGGIRVLAVGDFAQLPPISKHHFKPWCFRGDAWRRSCFQPVVLREVKRTEDAAFLEVLEDIRWGNVSERAEGFLNGRLAEDLELEEDVPHLFPRRAQTEAFNRSRLENLKTALRTYETEYGGEGVLIERMMKEAPIPPVLELKEGALVMMRINDPKQRFINGTVGHIMDMDDETLGIRVHGRRIELGRFTFSMQNEDGEEVAFAHNFPVNLAYASTIHKIQGTTLDRIHVDLRNLWEPGQAYVALSRARSGRGVTLMGWTPRSIKADSEVREFYQALAEGRMPEPPPRQDLFA